MTIATSDYDKLRGLRSSLQRQSELRAAESERLAVEAVLEEYPHWDLCAANGNGYVARREIVLKGQPHPRVLYANGPDAATVERRARYHEANLIREQQRLPRRVTKERTRNGRH